MRVSEIAVNLIIYTSALLIIVILAFACYIGEKHINRTIISKAKTSEIINKAILEHVEKYHKNNE